MAKTDLSFLDLVLPDVGIYIVAPFINRGEADPVAYQIFTYDKRNLANETYRQDARRDQTLYFSTASVVAEAGGNRHKNFLAKQCFHIDIDVGHHGFVSTQAEAIHELYRLCEEIGLPPPSVLVSSGYGVHAYWSLRVAYTASGIQRWQQLANGLVKAAGQITPRITKDVSKWADRTALLRLPGTRNKKQAQWQTVQEIGGTYRQYAQHEFDVLAEFEPQLPAVRTASAKRDVPLVDGDMLKEQCAVIRALAEARGDFGYKAWRDLIHLSHHTTQGVEWAHELSLGPRYNGDGVNRVYDYYAERHGTGEYNPPLCTTLCADAGMKHGEACVTCPLFLAGKSPLALPSAAPIEATISADVSELHALAQPSLDLPVVLTERIAKESATYHLTTNGGLGWTPEQQTEDDRGGHIFSHAWWCLARSDEGGVTYYDLARVMSVADERGLDGVARIAPSDVDVVRVRGDIFTEPKMLAKGLAAVGIHIEDAKSTQVRRHAYNYACLTRHECTTVRDAANSFGWQPDGRFVLGMGAFRKDGAIVPYSLSAEMRTLDKRTKVASGAINKNASLLGVYAALQDFASHASPLGKALLLAALSTPLYRLVDLPGYVILLAGPGGKGKTSLQRLLSCIYGQPSENMITAQDTVRSWALTIGMYNSLPVTFDEFTFAGKSGREDASEKDKDEFIYLITQGRTKQVSSSDQKRMGGLDRWATLCVASSNWDYVASLVARDYTNRCDAILARMSQVPVTSGIMPLQDWVRVEKAFIDNHGMIGAKFVAQLITHMDDIMPSLEAQFTALMAGRPTEARFKMKALTAIMVAQRVLKVDGIADFGLTADEVASLLELDRLNPLRSATSQWNRGSVTDDGSECNTDLIDLVLQMKQNDLLHYQEKSAGAYVPVALAAPPRKVFGTAVERMDGTIVYTLSKQLLLSDRELSSHAALASIVGSADSIRAALTQGGPEVECLRIERRKSGVVVSATGGP